MDRKIDTQVERYICRIDKYVDRWIVRTEMGRYIYREREGNYIKMKNAAISSGLQFWAINLVIKIP